MKQVSREKCHACGQLMRFELDMELNGNHVINCPECGHEHCRVIENGKVTGDRWDSRNGIQCYTVATSCDFGITVSTSSFLTDSWLNTETGTTSGYFTYFPSS